MPRNVAIGSTSRRSQQYHRSDLGTWVKTARDTDGWRLAAEQKYVRMDIYGEWFAPGYAKESERPADQGPKKRGGSRKETPWPPDHRHRMMAVQRLVSRWVHVMHMAEVWQPYKDQPPWVRLNRRGLDELHLDWPEIPWPNEEWLRDDGDASLSHTHRVNKARLALARGDVPDIPVQHIWHSERQIGVTLPLKKPGARLPHKTDGYLELTTDHVWKHTLKGGGVEEIPLPFGTTIGFELELTRKNFEVYGNHILPDLLRHYDFALYLATGDAYNAIVSARRDTLSSNEERKRIRILRFDPE